MITRYALAIPLVWWWVGWVLSRTCLEILQYVLYIASWWYKTSSAHLSNILQELQAVILSNVCMRNSCWLLVAFSGWMLELNERQKRNEVSQTLRALVWPDLTFNVGHSVRNKTPRVSCRYRKIISGGAEQTHSYHPKVTAIYQQVGFSIYWSMTWYFLSLYSYV